MNAVIANFQKEPEFIQQEDAEGNITNVKNTKRDQKIAGAVQSLLNSKSKQQLKSRLKSLFSALGYTVEDINKGLEDLNSVFDNVEPTNPGDIYEDFLKRINQEKLRALPATSEATVSEDVTGEAEIVTPQPEVVVSDITLDPEVPVEVPVEVPAEVSTEVVNPKLDGLTVKPVNHTNAQETKVSATSPTVFTNSNAVTQSNILKTVGKNSESYMVKVMDLFSFITEAIGKRAIPNLAKIYSKVGEAVKSGNQEEITALREEFMAIFPEGTFSTQMLDYIWEKQFILGKADQNVTINNADATPIQIAETYKKKEGVVTFFTGEKKVSYVVEVTGRVVDGKIEVISKKGLKTSLVSPSSFTPSTVLPINARAEFFQINSVMATIVNKSNGKLSTFDMEGKKTSKGKVNALVPLSRQDSAINEVRENIKTNTPINFTGPIVGNAAVNKAKSYEDSGVGVYLEFDNSNYSSTISTQTTVQFAPEVTTQPTQTSSIVIPSKSKENKEATIKAAQELNRQYSGIDSIVVGNIKIEEDKGREENYTPYYKQVVIRLGAFFNYKATSNHIHAPIIRDFKKIKDNKDGTYTLSGELSLEENSDLSTPVLITLPQEALTDYFSKKAKADSERAEYKKLGFKDINEAMRGVDAVVAVARGTVNRMISDALESAYIEQQPAVDESAVVVDIPKDLMNILTGNVTNKATSSQNNPITPDQQNQEEDAASCGIK
jgi:hypothetical protein